MVIVDTTVRVDYVKGVDTPEVAWLEGRHSRLHYDRDFDAFREHQVLSVVHS